MESHHDCATAGDQELRDLLDETGILRPTVFAQLARHDPGTAEARTAFRALLVGLKAPPDKVDDWASQCLRLHAVATGATPEIHARLAQRSGLEISADLVEFSLGRVAQQEAKDLGKLALHS